MTKAEMVRWVRCLYDEAVIVDTLETSEVCEAAVGSAVWVWDNLSVDCLRRLGPVLLRIARLTP